MFSVLLPCGRFTVLLASLSVWSQTNKSYMCCSTLIKTPHSSIQLHGKTSIVNIWYLNLWIKQRNARKWKQVLQYLFCSINTLGEVSHYHSIILWMMSWKMAKSYFCNRTDPDLIGNDPDLHYSNSAPEADNTPSSTRLSRLPGCHITIVLISWPFLRKQHY